MPRYNTWRKYRTVVLLVQLSGFDKQFACTDSCICKPHPLNHKKMPCNSLSCHDDRRNNKYAQLCTARFCYELIRPSVRLFEISRFIPSASPVLSRFTSLSTCQPILVIIPTLIIHHSFNLLLQAQNLPFQQILSTLNRLILPIGLPSHNGTGPDLSHSSVYY